MVGCTGGRVSLTLTAKVQNVEPTAQVTVVAPIGNAEPDGGSQVTCSGKPVSGSVQSPDEEGVV
jgi:hypothetical protein